MANQNPAPSASGDWTPRPNGNVDPTAETIARAFHEAYEEIAPRYSYETRAESAVPWPDVPISNRRLMIDTVRRLLLQGSIDPGPRTETEADRGAA